MELHKAYDRKVVEKPRATVVMIHGIASDSTSYNALLEVLEQREDLRDLRIVTFDLLGSGKSVSDDSLEYTYEEQLEALHNGILHLDLDSPLVLAGHSMGTFIVTRYASMYPGEVARLVLISPPVYTPEDFDNPLFKLGIEGFKQTVAAKHPNVVEQKAFINSMKNIVLDRDNYGVLAGMRVPTVLIYGDEDQLIASDNIPELLEKNPKIKAVKTHGHHGVSKDKFEKIFKVLKEGMDERRDNEKGGTGVEKSNGRGEK